MAYHSLARRADMRLSMGVRVAVRVLLALGAGCAVLSPVHATTFVRMDERDLAARSVAAVLGTVTSTRAAAAGDGGIVTTVVLVPEQVVLGTLPPGPLTLRERGGTLGHRSERIFGSAEYRVGERVLAFLSRGADGALHTTAMAMGKYRVDDDAAGAARVSRAFDGEVAVLDPDSGRLLPGGTVETDALAAVVRRVHDIALAPQPPALGRAATTHRSPHSSPAFTYLGRPSRWFEPDDGVPVRFRIDPAGDAALGADVSVAAAVDALAAWSEVDGTALMLVDGTLDQPLPFAGCAGDARVVFNDPFDEIDPPVDCHGVLGIGGYCYTDETRTVDGTAFQRIRLGKVTLGNGWGGCPFWNACNLAEVITHEVGHAIGLGHSQDAGATMAAAARFDGRCAGLAADDAAAVRAIYPARSTATPTPSSTVFPSPMPTASRTHPLTPLATPTPRSSGHSSVSGRIRYYGSDVPVSGASVELRGAATRQRTSTTAGGQFAFPDVADGTWVVEPSKTGDTGFAVSALDAAWVLQAVAGLRSMTTVQALACDVTGDGSLSALDAAHILQRKVGELDRFSAASLCASDWLFVPEPAPTPGQYLAVPALAAPSCMHGAVVLAPLQGDARGQDLRAAVFGDCTGNWEPSGDTGTAEPEMAPPGTTLEMPAPLRRPAGHWLQPIAVRAPADIHALDLELRYDATRLQLVRVRAVHLVDPAILQARSPQPGRVTIAVAGAYPLPTDGRAVLVAEFTSAESEVSPRLVRAFSAAVDERIVPTPVR